MKRIYRSVRDKKVFGVCGGLAEAMNIDPTILRIVLVIVTFFSGFATVPVYVIAAMVIPKDPTYEPTYGNAGSYGGTTGWNATPPPPPPPPNAWNSKQPPNREPRYGQPTQGYYPPNEAAKGPSIDDLMEDIEKKAMSKEIEELKAKLAQYEKGQKGDD